MKKKIQSICNCLRGTRQFQFHSRRQIEMMAVENSRNLTLLIIFHLLILTHGLAVSPKLDFGDSSGLVEVKKDIKTGKIKGLRVTVDTSELKGVKFF